MTVGELIEALSAYPSDARVVVDGYEGGYCDPIVRAVPVVLDQPYAWGGPHSEAYEYVDDATLCVLVSRSEP